MERKYASEALMVTHQAAQDLFELEVIDAARMGEFDELCLADDAGSEAEVPGSGKQQPIPAFALTK